MGYSKLCAAAALTAALAAYTAVAHAQIATNPALTDLQTYVAKVAGSSRAPFTVFTDQPLPASATTVDLKAVSAETLFALVNGSNSVTGIGYIYDPDNGRQTYADMRALYGPQFAGAAAFADNPAKLRNAGAGAAYLYGNEFFLSAYATTADSYIGVGQAKIGSNSLAVDPNRTTLPNRGAHFASDSVGGDSVIDADRVGSSSYYGTAIGNTTVYTNGQIYNPDNGRQTYIGVEPQSGPQYGGAGIVSGDLAKLNRKGAGTYYFYGREFFLSAYATTEDTYISVGQAKIGSNSLAVDPNRTTLPNRGAHFASDSLGGDSVIDADRVGSNSYYGTAIGNTTVYTNGQIYNPDNDRQTYIGVEPQSGPQYAGAGIVSGDLAKLNRKGAGAYYFYGREFFLSAYATTEDTYISVGQAKIGSNTLAVDPNGTTLPDRGAQISSDTLGGQSVVDADRISSDSIYSTQLGGLNAYTQNVVYGADYGRNTFHYNDISYAQHYATAGAAIDNPANPNSAGAGAIYSYGNEFDLTALAFTDNVTVSVSQAQLGMALIEIDPADLRADISPRAGYAVSADIFNAGGAGLVVVEVSTPLGGTVVPLGEGAPASPTSVTRQILGIIP